MQHKILVVEDDQAIAHLVQMHLRDCGFEVDVVHDGAEADQRICRESFGLLILDLSLPGLDGLELCRRVRSREPYVPILMLTAHAGERDRVAGLDIGADDYLGKPFSVRELQARVRAIFRRADAMSKRLPQPGPPTIRLGDLTIDVERRLVSLDGKPISLRAKEFALLLEFASHPGKVYSRAELLEAVWKYGHDGYRHTVNTHINRLRTKIEKNPAQPEFIRTIWGIGYQLAAQSAPA